LAALLTAVILMPERLVYQQLLAVTYGRAGDEERCLYHSRNCQQLDDYDQAEARLLLREFAGIDV
jgi:hypothetical protein